MYPKNGQSAEQQATDKAECQQWAVQQAGTGGAEWPRLHARNDGLRRGPGLQREVGRAA